MARIQERARGVETGITVEYLTALNANYQAFIRTISRTVPVIKVSWEQYRSPAEMAEVIHDEYLRGSFLREVQWNPIVGV